MNFARARVLVLASATGLGALAGLASPAQAKTWRVTASDPSGDSVSANRDITEVKLRYKSNGSLLFVITVAAPIDAANGDAGVGVSLGRTCKKLLALGGGAFSAPDPVRFAKVTGNKIGKDRIGKGEITSNVYTLSVKHSSFKNWKPGCFAVALVDPAGANTETPSVFDETAEIKIKK